MPTIDRLQFRDTRTAADWDAFLLVCDDATFFHRSAWQELLRQSFGHDTHFLYAHEAGRITGVLPLAHVRSVLFGNSLSSLPFAAYAGVAASNEASALALEAAAENLARRLKVDHLELRQLSRRHEDWPRQDLYVTFRKPILANEEANLLAIPRKQRAMVRKGIKEGLRSEMDAGLDRFFAMYAGNVHRHGTPALPRRYFESLRRAFGTDCDVLTVVDAGGAALSSVLSFYFKGTAMPYYAGDVAAARDVAANDFKYWELMRLACERGLQVFDYGRSKQGTGPYAFKRNWGFEPTPLNYEYRLFKRDAVPQNNPSNAKYKLMIEAWRRLPIGVANRLGPFVVRALG